MKAFRNIERVERKRKGKATGLRQGSRVINGAFSLLKFVHGFINESNSWFQQIQLFKACIILHYISII